MVTVAKFILFVALSFTATGALAQKPKPAAPATKPGSFQKFTPPKLVTMLGIRSDTATVYREEAIQLVKLPLRITDDKKGVYTISSYRAQYRRRAVTEDEESGKVTPIISTVSDIFKETPLPERWTKILVERLRDGEELYFYDIIAKDANGRLMFAPVLLIKVK